MKRHEFIGQWRNALGLPFEFVSRVSKVEPARLSGIEAGTADPTIDEIESLARALGLEGDALLEDELPERLEKADPTRMLLKSAEDFRPAADVRHRMVVAARAALDLLDWQRQLAPSGRAGFESFYLKAITAKPLHVQGRDLAIEVRKCLSVNGPVGSVRDLVAQALGIPVVAAELSLVGPDAFSVYAPGHRAAIVVNLSGKNANGLVRRFSLAHEVCHVLFDRPAAGPLGVACWNDAERRVDVETRANAFAIHLLLPEKDLKAEGDKVFEPPGFRRVMAKWGVHLTALRLYVSKLHRLSTVEIAKLPLVDPTPPLWVREAEELPAERGPAFGVPSERRGELVLLAARAFAAGKLTRAGLREVLQVPASAPLDELLDFLNVAVPQST